MIFKLLLFISVVSCTYALHHSTEHTKVHHHKINRNYIEVISIVDAVSMFACMVKIHSIVESSRHKHMLSFRFLLMDNSSTAVIDNMFASCFRGIRFEIKKWETPIALSNIKGVGFDTSIIYSRMYLPDIFNVDKYIYIDNDVVVNADMYNLFNLKLDVRPFDDESKRVPVSFSEIANNQLVGKHRQIPQRQHPSTSVYSKTPAVMGFVYDRNRVNRGYLSKHLNLTHPLVKSVFRRNDPDVFFNGGVALVDAAMWRKQGLTKKAEELLLENREGALFNSGAIGDQGLFYLLLDRKLTTLPAVYNMRRLPNKTVRYLNQSLLGIVHFAGGFSGTGNKIVNICEHPITYPYLSSGAVPLFLSAVASLKRKCNSSYLDIPQSCTTAVSVIMDEEAAGKLKVNYNPGYGDLGWPPRVEM